MNINKMIDMLLLEISKDRTIYYIEKRTYKEMKSYKTYIISFNKQTEEFKNKIDLLKYLKELV